MPVQNVIQLRRLVLRKKASAADSWTVLTIEPDELGQDTVLSVNVAPRMKTRASSLGTSTTPIPGTFDSLEASITFLMDTYKILGEAIGKWAASTYQGADANAGQVIYGDGEICGDGEYVSVIAQGICDDGSASDIEITRCFPSVDDALEFGTTDTPTVTLNLHPVAYNASLYSADGYPQYTVRFGENDLTKKQRLNAVSGEYDDVSE